MTELIYKVLRQKEWEELIGTGKLAGSPDDVRDGFIHFSNAAQVHTTFDKWFAREDNLFLAAVESARLGGRLKWEMSRGGDRFPHFYGVLTLDLVDSVAEIRRDANGKPIFPR
jgi:uncharacterized protein (DUF952 family)